MISAAVLLPCGEAFRRPRSTIAPRTVSHVMPGHSMSAAPLARHLRKDAEQGRFSADTTGRLQTSEVYSAALRRAGTPDSLRWLAAER